MRTGRSLTVCWSLLPGGVSAPGGGVCFRGGGSAPGGISQHPLRQTPPVDRQTPVKIFPWPNFVAADNNVFFWKNRMQSFFPVCNDDRSAQTREQNSVSMCLSVDVTFSCALIIYLSLYPNLNPNSNFILPTYPNYKFNRMPWKRGINKWHFHFCMSPDGSGILHESKCYTCTRF